MKLLDGIDFDGVGANPFFWYRLLCVLRVCMRLLSPWFNPVVRYKELLCSASS